MNDPVILEVGGRQVLVDLADAEAVTSRRWTVARCGSKDYATSNVAGRTAYMHRVILGAASGTDVDHINGDGLDNRRANLRPATRSQNMANRPATKGKRFKGVQRVGQRWRAQIMTLYAQRHIGYFDTEEQAARAYDEAARAAFGRFARLNFPEGV